MSDLTLVVGATGQLGSLVVAELARRGGPVRALTRRPAQARFEEGVEVVHGDLVDIASLRQALAGVATVVATASAAAPRKGDSVRAVEDQGYANLLAVAQTCGVRRFVFTSVPQTPLDDAVPLLRAKRVNEVRLQASGLDYRILRFPMFMESWLALVGSSLPLRGEPHATLERPFGFLSVYRKVTGRMVEGRGVMLVPGPSTHRNALISVRDAARLLASAAQSDALAERLLQCGGPEILTWDDVAGIFADVLGRPVRVATTPAEVFAGIQRVLAPVNAGAANIMGLNRVTASSETPWPPADLDPAPEITVRRFLEEKAALPGD